MLCQAALKKPGLMMPNSVVAHLRLKATEKGGNIVTLGSAVRTDDRADRAVAGGLDH